MSVEPPADLIDFLRLLKIPQHAAVMLALGYDDVRMCVCMYATWGVMRTPGAAVGPVMPQVTGTWGRERWCEAQSRTHPLPCPGHWVHHIGAK